MIKCFDFQQMDKLKSYMYNSCNIHDGIFEKATYDDLSKTVTVKITNPCWGGEYGMIFSGVVFYLCFGDNVWGNDHTIITLSVEEKCNKLDCLVDWESDVFSSKLCFVFEQLSGNQIYIICTEVQFLTEDNTEDSSES